MFGAVVSGFCFLPGQASRKEALPGLTRFLKNLVRILMHFSNALKGAYLINRHEKCAPLEGMNGIH